MDRQHSVVDGSEIGSCNYKGWYLESLDQIRDIKALSDRDQDPPDTFYDHVFMSFTQCLERFYDSININLRMSFYSGHIGGQRFFKRIWGNQFYGIVDTGRFCKLDRVLRDKYSPPCLTAGVDWFHDPCMNPSFLY